MKIFTTITETSRNGDKYLYLNYETDNMNQMDLAAAKTLIEKFIEEFEDKVINKYPEDF